jgi:elongation factor G
MAEMPHSTDQIRNVALIGHGGVGKTTVAEALLHAAGVTSRVGRVDDGTSVLDREPEEIDRRSTVSLALASFDWTTDGGATYRVNLLDTPGHPDFEADVNAALAVADLAVIVVSATDGVEIGTEVAWHKCVELGLPRIFFVTREDKHRADFDAVVVQLRDKFGAGVTPIEMPLGEAETLHGLADVLHETAIEYDSAGHHTEAVPADIADREHAVHDQLVEEIVSGDDAQLERYLEGEIPTADELEHTLAAEVLGCTEFPVLLGSGATGVGIDTLGDYICLLGPSPADRPASVVAGDQQVEVSADPSGAPLLQVFKTISDQYMGQISLFKVVSGSLGADTTLRDTTSGRDERVHAPFHLRGGEQTPAGKVVAGDLAGAAKLTAATGATLAPQGQPVTIEPPRLPAANLAVTLVPATQNDDDKLSNALSRLVDEDPALQVGHDPITRRTVLRGVGDAHLHVAVARLARKYGVTVKTDAVPIEFRRTVTQTVETEGRLKKQSGGHGQFAVVNLRVSPLPRGEGFDFVDKVVGGAIPKQYVAAVKLGIEEAMTRGGSDAIPVVDVRVECLDGKTHSVDSSDMAFRTAASTGFFEAVQKAAPALLEPISLITVEVPTELQGDVLGDLSSRRARVVGSDVEGGMQTIRAEVPTVELATYAIDVRALTGGRGRLTIQHHHYDVVPDHVAGKLLESRAK